MLTCVGIRCKHVDKFIGYVVNILDILVGIIVSDGGDDGSDDGT